MSKYSGKCDVYDHLGDKSDEYIANSDIYFGYEAVPLRINSQKDLMPYYPHLVCMAICSNGKHVVNITERSFVDTEEEEILNCDLEELKRLRRSKKRKHEEFIPKDAVNKLSIFFNHTEYKIELANRVAESGDKATIDDIHIPFSDYYRRILYEDMIAAGYTERFARWWVYKDWKSFTLKRYEDDCE